jgi:ankyrin repeat protein
MKALDARLVHNWLSTAERGDLPALKEMVASEPRLLDASGQGPYWTGHARALHFASHRGHLRVVRWLLAQGAAPNNGTGDIDWAPLHFAAVAQRRAVYALLVKHGAVPDIFTASALGDVREVRRLLRSNPRLVSKRGPDGGTALHFATTPAVARALLAAGANPRLRDRFHKSTPVEWTLERPAVAHVIAAAAGRVDIFTAAALGNVAAAGRLLRAKPNLLAAVVRKEAPIGVAGETPLGVAAAFGRRRMVEYLLKRGASAAVQPSPLPGAVQNGDRAVVTLLLAAGADPDALGPHGFAALHAACISGHVPMIRLLLARGARLDLRDATHHATPLDWAEYHQQAAAAEVLRRAAQ